MHLWVVHKDMNTGPTCTYCLEQGLMLEVLPNIRPSFPAVSIVSNLAMLTWRAPAVEIV